MDRWFASSVLADVEGAAVSLGVRSRPAGLGLKAFDLCEPAALWVKRTVALGFGCGCVVSSVRLRTGR